MFSIYLFTCWQDSVLILSALKRNQACSLSWCSNTSKGEETRNLLRTTDHLLQPLNFKSQIQKGNLTFLVTIRTTNAKGKRREAVSGKPYSCTKTWVIQSWKSFYWLLPKLLQTWMCMQSPKIRNPRLFYIKATTKDNSNQLISATGVKEEMSPKQKNETSKTSPENCMNAAWSLRSNDQGFLQTYGEH